MQRSTKKILDELYEIDPSLKSEANLKSLVVFMEHHVPKVKPSKEFKDKLWKKLTTILEFEQIQPKKKFNPMIILAPIFFMGFSIFAVLQLHSFITINNIDESLLPSSNSQEFIIDDVWDVENSITDNVLEEDVATQEKEVIGETIAEENEEQEAIESQTDDDWGTISWDGINTQNEASVQNNTATESETNTWNTPISNTVVDESEQEVEVQKVPVRKEVISTDNVDQKNDTNRSSNTINTSVQVENEANRNWTEADFETSRSVEADQWNISSKWDSTVEASLDVNESDEKINSDSINATSDVEEEAKIVDAQSFGVSWAAIQENDIADSEEDKREVIQPAPTISVQGDYYTCLDWEIDYIDEIDMKRIIKTYCRAQWWEFEVDEGLCALNAKQRVGIEYIQRDLCE
jgi:hypothetical protein